MINTEILEIKKQFTHDNCSITKISGCYVDGEKTVKSQFTETFLSMPEEETFKYFEIFKKTLSGSIGKNLINMEFPQAAELEEGQQTFLLNLLDSKLKDETILDKFYNSIIQSYEYTGNYLILLINAAYDIPGKTKDKQQMEDASDEVYQYILCSICPVKLSKPGLSYNTDTNSIKKRIQDWVVDKPINGFLFPAFNDRSTDIHSLLYYAKDPEDLNKEFVNQLLSCELPMTAETQKEVFQQLIEETLGEECEYETVRNIHEKLNDIIEEHKMKEIPEPLLLDKKWLKDVFEECGVEEEKISEFNQLFDKLAGDDTKLLASNITSTRTFEITTPDIIIKVNPEHSNLVQTRSIDGRNCLVIEINDKIEVNGITVKPV